MTKTLIKDTLRSIAANKLRFLSVAIIVALGMSFYVGINSASPAMKYEANEYFVKNNLMDVWVTSPIAFTNDDIAKIEKIKNVTQVTRSQYVDGYATLGRDSLVNKNGTELTCRVSLLDSDKAQAFLDGKKDDSYINCLDLNEGRLPQKVDECVVDSKSAELYPDIEIGKSVNIADGDSGAELSLTVNKFTVVGIVTSPRYISPDKGQTKLGSGTLDSFIYVLPSAFSSGEFNELFVKMKYSEYLDSFSDEYTSRAKKIAEQIKKVSEGAIDVKLADLKTEYTEKIKDKQSEITAYNLSSSTQLKDKEKSIKEFKDYVDNEDKVLASVKEDNEAKINNAASSLKSLESRLSSLNSSYQAHVKSMDQQSSEIKGYSELKRLYDDLSEKHDAARTELDTLSGTYQSKQNDLDSKNAEIELHEEQISSLESRISRLTSEISSLESSINSLNSKASSLSEKVKTQTAIVNNLKSEISRLDAIIADSSTDAMDKAEAMNTRSQLKRNLSTAENELNSLTADYNDTRSSITSATNSKTKKEAEKQRLITTLSNERNALATAKSERSVLQAEVSNAKSNYDAAQKAYDADEATLAKYKSSMNDLTKGQTSLTNLIAQVESEKAELDSLNNSVTEAQIRYTLASRNSSVEVSKAEYDLKIAKSRYGTVDDEYTELKNDIQSKKDSLSNELKALETTLGNLSNLRWSATPRNELSGIDSFSISLENIKSMSSVFPIVFFLTAMIACFVIMVKNVEEERKEIGVFKSFGYSNISIVGKFMLYSILAWLMGIFLGGIIGTCILPFAICSIYNMTYSVPNVGTVFLAKYVFIGIGLSFVMTVAATLTAAIRELKYDPATLMRPKNISYNRRNFLEKIPALWNKMSYGMVVVARTVARSRSRVAVSTLGIACCTALILSSLGLINSTMAVSGKQYGDKGVFNYDVLFVLKTPQTNDADILKDIRKDQRVESAVLFSKNSLTASADADTHESKRAVSVVSIKDTDDYAKFTNFKTTDGSLDFGNGNIVITDKMAADLGIGVGDSLYLTSADGVVSTASVSGIVRNYTNHYVYMSSETYESVFGNVPHYKYIVVTAKKYVQENDVKNLASTFLKEDSITGASTASDMADSVDVSIDRILAVVLMFVLSACLLALIVMYTNSNVNLSERTREIANIKVIGLSDNEVLIYVIRENIISTIYGAILGMIAGIFLHKALIGFISVDNIVYGSSIAWWSFIVTLIVVALISLISSLPIKLKIDKISMAETLKEIE